MRASASTSLLMQGCRVRNAVPVSPRPSGTSSLSREFEGAHLLGVRSEARDNTQQFGVVVGSAMVVEVNLAPFAVASQTRSNSSVRDLRPQDGFVRRA